MSFDIKVLFIFCSSVFVFNLACAQDRTDSLLRSLNAAIENRNVYVQARLKRIEELKNELQSTRVDSLQARFNLYSDLYNEYKIFIYDSAFSYAQKLSQTAYQLKDKSKIGYSQLKLGFILISSGMYKEAFDSLKAVEKKYLPDSIKVEYNFLMARAFYDLSTFNHDRYYQYKYLNNGNLYVDSALMLCSHNSYNYLYMIGYKNLYAKNFKVALQYLKKASENFTLTKQQRAVNFHNQSSIYQELGQSDLALEYLVKSSLSDIEAATKETAAMYNLAKLLYERGDVKDAYVYIEQAMDDAIFYGARQRKIDIGSIQPFIAAEKLNNVEEQRRLWLLYSTVVTSLSVLVLVFAFITFRQFRKLKGAEIQITETNNRLIETNKHLQEANAIKEEYIGYYFNINSEYIDKIARFKTGVDQKLLSKKFDDIRFIVNDINLKREREELYYSFDKVFLKLFPDFITTFNSHFKEEDRVVLKDNQLLNTELRIFALIRMGISDTEKIAKILDYSVNTIYAYKTRVKSRSLLQNEEFEAMIMSINSV